MSNDSVTPSPQPTQATPRCHLCKISTREEIETLHARMLLGESLAKLGSETQFSLWSIQEHRKHLAPELLAEIKKASRRVAAKHYKKSWTTHKRSSPGEHSPQTEARSLFALVCGGADAALVRKEILLTEVQRTMLCDLFGADYMENIFKLRQDVLAEFDALVSNNSPELRQEITEYRAGLIKEYAKRLVFRREPRMPKQVPPTDDWDGI